MIESIVIEFEKVTKYPLMKFMEEYRDFMLYSFSPLERYFSGASETIDNAHISALKKVTIDTRDVLQQFKNFSNKFEKMSNQSNVRFSRFLKFILIGG